jgi:hypothetical protein
VAAQFHHFVNLRRLNMLRLVSFANAFSCIGAARSATQRGLLLVAIAWLTNAPAFAQTRTLPSHGKIKLDSYNALLRDVHPASQAQVNFLQARLFYVGLNKAERLERQERLDAYRERQLTKALESYSGVTRRLAGGRPTSARNLTLFWVLVSVYGDHREVYDALSSDVPPISHEEFVPTTQFARIIEPSGELQPPPLLFEGAPGVNASKVQTAWLPLVEHLRATGRVSAQEVESFRGAVAEFREHSGKAIRRNDSAAARVQAKKYIVSLGSLSEALHRPRQRTQIQQYVEQGGYAFAGGSMLELIQHMLRNRVSPSNGSTAQLALAEVARPISRVLEQEIALHAERYDSLAAGEGHRPYASEYRPQDAPFDAMPTAEISQAIKPGETAL